MSKRNKVEAKTHRDGRSRTGAASPNSSGPIETVSSNSCAARPPAGMHPERVYNLNKLKGKLDNWLRSSHFCQGLKIGFDLHWKGIMGARPYPAERSGKDLRQNRDALLAACGLR